MVRCRLLSVVVPVHDEGDGIGVFYARTKQVLEDLSLLSHEIVFIDDGSEDASFERLKELARRDPRVRVVRLSRQFGHQIAITAGLEAAGGDAVVVIDADLQDPPELIKAFVEKWEEGYDVVYGVRSGRDGETCLKLWTAALFYRLLRALIEISIPVDVGDFRLMSRRIVDQLGNLRETDRFVRGLVSWVGFRQIGVPYAREQRIAGESKYRYRQMSRLAVDAITSFSSAPLRLASAVGCAALGIGLLSLFTTLAREMAGHTTQAWEIVVVGALLLGGLQLVCTGIMGEYLGRMFRESKRRPLYVIDEVFETRFDLEGQSTPRARLRSGPRQRIPRAVRPWPTSSRAFAGHPCRRPL